MKAFIQSITSAIEALFLWLMGKPQRRAPDLPDEVPVSGEPKWLQLARGELGVKEIPGPEHNPRVLRYYADAGHPEVNDDETAWCAGFTGAMLERAGVPCSKSLMARSYLQWGKVVAKPKLGDIAVFSRGDPRGTQGHVGFYMGEDAQGILVLGGNQGNKVSIAHQDKARLLGYRTPVTATNSRTVRATTASMALAGVGGAVVLDSQTQLMGISAIFKEMGVSIPSFQIAAYMLQIVVLCVIVWARFDDLKSKGR